jgi:hypothetical protein
MMKKRIQNIRNLLNNEYVVQHPELLKQHLFAYSIHEIISWIFIDIAIVVAYYIILSFMPNLFPF